MTMPSISVTLTLPDGSDIRAVFSAPAGKGSVRLEKTGGGAFFQAYTSAASDWEFKYGPADDPTRAMWTKAVRDHIKANPQLMDELRKLDLEDDLDRALREAARYAKSRRDELRKARVARMKIRALGLPDLPPREPEPAPAEPEKVPA